MVIKKSETLSLKLRGEVVAGDTNVRPVSIQMVFKYIGKNKIIIWCMCGCLFFPAI